MYFGILDGISGKFMRHNSMTRWHRCKANNGETAFTEGLGMQCEQSYVPGL